VTAADFTEPEVFYQIGVEPVRADFMTSTPGLVCADAWKRRIEADFGGETAWVIGREDLLPTKTATGRKRDRRDTRRWRKR
jgi:hypothetical protein